MLTPHCPAQSTFDNPEWFYRHVDAHCLCCDYQAVGKDSHVVLCAWKGRLCLPLPLEANLGLWRACGSQEWDQPHRTRWGAGCRDWGPQVQLREFGSGA